MALCKPFTAYDALKVASSLSAVGLEKPRCPLTLCLGLGSPGSTDSTGALKGMKSALLASAVGSEKVSPLAFLFGLGLLTGGAALFNIFLDVAAGSSDTLFLASLRFGI